MSSPSRQPRYDLKGYVGLYTGLTHRIRFKAQTDKPTAQLSSNDITGAGLFVKSKDVDLVQ